MNTEQRFEVWVGNAKPECMCDYAGRECCPLHVTAEDAQGWIDYMEEAEGA